MTGGEFWAGGWYLRDRGWIGAGGGRGLSSGWMARVTAVGE